MVLQFVGADHEVTGSCHYLRVGEMNILIDYGMEQGRNVYENQPLPVKPANIQYVFLTHAHIDHSGMLPALFAQGFRGKILCTEATKDLCEIMILDSAHIQMQEAEYRNKKAAKNGVSGRYEPVYTMEEAQAVLGLFQSYEYGKVYDLCEGVKFRFTDIGHLLGSASIELWLSERGVEKKIVFSGDIGNKNQPLLRDPQYTKSADYVVMESTYGDRLHEKPKTSHIEQLTKIIHDTLLRGGNVVIPSFAVGRTQVLLYFIKQIKASNMIPEFPNFPVYVDSPMAVRAISVFEDNGRECYDTEAAEMIKKGINPLSFPNLHLSITTEESIAINDEVTPKVIISASGMCDAGRIKHHLKHNITNEKSTILFVGYQAVGTLGRRLLDGAQTVKIFGEEFPVNAEVTMMDGMSGHADQAGLLEWIDAFEEKPKMVFVVHGEDEVTESFADLLESEHGVKAMAPFSGTQFDLANGDFIRIARGKKIEHGDGSRPASDSFTKLKIAEKRLEKVIEASKGLTNKDLDKFTKEINDLCRRYQIPEVEGKKK